MTRMYIVADDSMEGRRAGDAGGVRGTDYIARELQRLGVEPGGDNGTWFQNVPLVRVGMHTRSLSVDGQSFTPDDFTAINFPQGGYGQSVQVTSVPVVYAGRVGDTTALPAARTNGALLLFAPQLVNGAPVRTPAITMGQLAAHYPSAAAIAFAHYDLYSPTDRAQLIGGPTSISNPARQVISGRPALLYVTESAAARLLGRPLATATAGQAGARATISVAVGEQPLPTPARNVIGIIRGSDPALRGQYVAIGSHNDHVGVRAAGPIDHDSVKIFNTVLRKEGAEQPPEPGTAEDWARIRRMLDSARAKRAPRMDSIYNGADDDGSGTVAMLEVAEAFATARTKPKRSILLVWHTAEELGLFGANYFTRTPTVPRDSIVAQVNLDMIGRGRAEDTPGGGPNYLQLLGSKRLSTEFGALIDSLAALPSYRYALDYQFDAPGHPNQFYCRSDHYMYARYGIPIVFFSTGGHADYHMLTDEPQYIDYPNLFKATRFVHDVSAAVANRPARLVVDQPKPDPNGQCRQ